MASKKESKKQSDASSPVNEAPAPETTTAAPEFSPPPPEPPKEPPAPVKAPKPELSKLKPGWYVHVDGKPEGEAHPFEMAAIRASAQLIRKGVPQSSITIYEVKA